MTIVARDCINAIFFTIVLGLLVSNYIRGRMSRPRIAMLFTLIRHMMGRNLRCIRGQLLRSTSLLWQKRMHTSKQITLTSLTHSTWWSSLASSSMYSATSRSQSTSTSAKKMKTKVATTDLTTWPRANSRKSPRNSCGTLSTVIALWVCLLRSPTYHSTSHIWYSWSSVARSACLIRDRSVQATINSFNFQEKHPSRISWIFQPVSFSLKCSGLPSASSFSRSWWWLALSASSRPESSRNRRESEKPNSLPTTQRSSSETC